MSERPDGHHLVYVDCALYHSLSRLRFAYVGVVLSNLCVLLCWVEEFLCGS